MCIFMLSNIFPDMNTVGFSEGATVIRIAGSEVFTVKRPSTVFAVYTGILLFLTTSVLLKNSAMHFVSDPIMP